MSTSNDPNQYRLPKRINDPPTLFIYPANQVAVFFMLMGAGLILEFTIAGTVLGIVAFYVMHYTGLRYPRGYLTHLAYWYDLAFQLKYSKAIPPSTKREFFQ